MMDSILKLWSCFDGVPGQYFNALTYGVLDDVFVIDKELVSFTRNASVLSFAESSIVSRIDPSKGRVYTKEDEQNSVISDMIGRNLLLLLLLLRLLTIFVCSPITKSFSLQQ